MENFKIIEMQIDDLISFRSLKNLGMYLEGTGPIYDVFVQSESNIILTSKISKKHPKWSIISPNVNKPIMMTDERVVTHNFADNTTWPATDNSLFTISPSANSKYVVTHIQIRFPQNSKLTQSNKITFKVYKSLDGNPLPTDGSEVPIISLEYGSVHELIKKSNSDVVISTDIIPNAFNTKMVELQFKYANPSTLEGSPIILRSSLNEKIAIQTSANETVKDTSDQALTENVWCIINCKKLVDF